LFCVFSSSFEKEIKYPKSHTFTVISSLLILNNKFLAARSQWMIFDNIIISSINELKRRENKEQNKGKWRNNKPVHPVHIIKTTQRIER